MLRVEFGHANRMPSSPADTGDESLIEFSFRNQNGIYTPDIDVSFVYVENPCSLVLQGPG